MQRCQLYTGIQIHYDITMMMLSLSIKYRTFCTKLSAVRTKVIANPLGGCFYKILLPQFDTKPAKYIILWIEVIMIIHTFQKSTAMMIYY
jgi:hypothetical protein